MLDLIYHCSIIINKKLFPVADPGFIFLRGAQTPKVGVITYYFTIFCRKLHKMKEFGPRAGRRPSAPSLGSANGFMLLVVKLMFIVTIGQR